MCGIAQAVLLELLEQVAEPAVERRSSPAATATEQPAQNVAEAACACSCAAGSSTTQGASKHAAQNIAKSTTKSATRCAAPSRPAGRCCAAHALGGVGREQSEQRLGDRRHALIRSLARRPWS